MSSSEPVPSCLHGGVDPLHDLKLWNLIIRPPRAWYDVKAFGPCAFHLDGVRVTREDIQLTTPRGVRLECSHFRPEPEVGKEAEPTPVVVYLHGNASSRLEALQVLRPLLVRRMAVFCYDSAGCGLSEGEYVSLGWYERDDLAAVIEHLRRSPLCSTVGLWGRSMGAATALLHCDRDPSIGAVCADSAFASLPDLMQDVAQGEYALVQTPAWLTTMLQKVVRMRVKALADFDTDDVVPLDHVKKCHMPALFIHAQRDRFIPVEHTQRLFAQHAGDKEILEIQGQHNSIRGRMVVGHVVDFFCRAFRHESRPLALPSRLPFGELTNLPDYQPTASSGSSPCSPSGTVTSDSRCHFECQSPTAAAAEVAASPRHGSIDGTSPRHGSIDGPSPSSSSSGGSSKSAALKTPPSRSLPQAPQEEKDGEVCTPPAVVVSATSPSSFFHLPRERCEALGLKALGRRGRARDRHAGDKLLVGKKMKQPVKQPHEGALERMSTMATVQDALDLLEDMENAIIMDRDPHSSSAPSRFLKESCTHGRQGVYPTLSPSLLFPRVENLEDAENVPPLDNGGDRGGKCCDGLTGSVFGSCLVPGGAAPVLAPRRRSCIIPI